MLRCTRTEIYFTTTCFGKRCSPSRRIKITIYVKIERKRFHYTCSNNLFSQKRLPNQMLIIQCSLHSKIVKSRIKEHASKLLTHET